MSANAGTSVAVFVAIKPLAAAKSRFTGVEDAQRQALVLAMLDDVLASIRSAHEGILTVISEDPSYDALAERHRARREPDAATGYRAAVQAELIAAASAGTRAALIVPADVPGLTAHDVEALLGALETVEVVLAPGIDGGTSALGLRPPTAIPVAFGPQSGWLHRRLAEVSGRRLAELALASLAVDVDTLDDLEAAARVAGPATTKVIESIRAASR
ncbi:MAG: 2-phospho-L-lactate guanylyltransferase [Dehalococcoidia bacterium]